MPRRRNSLDNGFPGPPPRPGLIDRDLQREMTCFMCGRTCPEDVRPIPKVCPTCGGNWIVTEDYVPRYG